MCSNKYNKQKNKLVSLIEKVKKSNNIVDTEFNNIQKFYLNLDTSIDRKEKVESDIERLKIKNIERISGFDGRKLEDTNTIDIFGKNIKNSYNSDKLKPELGCFFSHIKAIKKAYEMEMKTLIVLEDDIIMDFSKVWKKSFKEILDGAPKDWELINMSNFFGKPNYDGEYIPYSKHPFLSTIFYIINEKGIKKINDSFDEGYFDNTSIRKPVSDFFLFENCISYTMKNVLVPSDICMDDSTISNSKIDGRCLLNIKHINNLFIDVY